MSEVNPDPILKLAKFSPTNAIDPVELLFAAGRASARTHWGWKAAVVALALSNAALGTFLVFGSRDVPPVAVPAPVPVVRPEPMPAPPSAPAPVDEPWSYRALRTTDAELAPNIESVTNLVPSREPLTILSGRRGDID